MCLVVKKTNTRENRDGFRSERVGVDQDRHGNFWWEFIIAVVIFYHHPLLGENWEQKELLHAVAIAMAIIILLAFSVIHRPFAFLIHHQPRVSVVLLLVLRRVIEEALPQQIGAVYAFIEIPRYAAN